MTCDSRRLQDLLDGELGAAESAALRDHLRGCPRCAAELALYRRTFDALSRLSLAAPAPALAERVLERTLPQRLRRRWARALGWSYAAALAACSGAAALVLSRPEAWAVLASAGDRVSDALVRSFFLGVQAVSFTVLSLVDGWGLLTAASDRLSPLGRALGALLSMSGIQATLAVAALACALLLLWLRPRDQRSGRGVRHVGVLGF